jgi:hypothetical protein
MFGKAITYKTTTKCLALPNIEQLVPISKKSDSIFVTDCLLISPSSKPFTRFEF